MPLSEEEFDAVRRLARRISVEPAQMHLVLGLGVECFYRKRRKPKRGGGFRTILAPQEPLLTIQKQLLEVVFGHIEPSEIAHAFTPDRSIVTNAAPHINSRSILLVDFSNAFDSVSFRDTGLHLVKIGKAQACLVQRLVEFQTSVPRPYQPLQRWFLPQGAPTSGLLFNLACTNLDAKLIKLANNTGCVVTRYADNVCFSSPKPDINQVLVRAVTRTIERANFSINHKKTALIRNGNRFGVPLRLCGINIMEGELYLDPATIKRYRMMLYCAGKAYAKATDPEEKKHRWHEYAGIRGHVFQVYGGWPNQLKDIWPNAYDSCNDVGPKV